MMLTDVLRDLYEYNEWANERVLDAAARLSPEAFSTPDDTPHGSIRDTLLHMILAQYYWLSWWDGTAPTREDALRLARERFDPARHPDIASIRASWRDVQGRTQTFLAGINDDTATATFSSTRAGSAWSIPLWKLMTQVAIHGAQHRSEIAVRLTSLGHSPGDLDYIFYLWEQNATTPSA
jgi:uncharacterized damage-inducible protein DinB